MPGPDLPPLRDAQRLLLQRLRLGWTLDLSPNDRACLTPPDPRERLVHVTAATWRPLRDVYGYLDGRPALIPGHTALALTGAGHVAACGVDDGANAPRVALAP